MRGEVGLRGGGGTAERCPATLIDLCTLSSTVEMSSVEKRHVEKVHVEKVYVEKIRVEKMYVKRLNAE